MIVTYTRFRVVDSKMVPGSHFQREWMAAVQSSLLNLMKDDGLVHENELIPGMPVSEIDGRVFDPSYMVRLIIQDSEDSATITMQLQTFYEYVGNVGLGKRFTSATELIDDMLMALESHEQNHEIVQG